MGQPSVTVFVDNVGTPHTFIKLDDGNGKVEYFGFAPRSPGSPHGPGIVGQGLTTHVRGDPNNSRAGYIDDVGWSKMISANKEQYDAMKSTVLAWSNTAHTYNGLATLGGENCVTFVQSVLKAGGVTELTTSRTSLPINLIPADERRDLFITDADGRRSPSGALKDPLYTPGTPAYEYKQAYPEQFISQSVFLRVGDRTISELHINPDGSYVEEISQIGLSKGDKTEIQYDASGTVFQVIQTDGARNNTDYSTHTTTYDTEGRIDLIEVIRDDRTRDLTDYDRSGTQSWSRIDSRFDAQGRLDHSIETVDDGSTTKTDYDQAGTRGDSIWQIHNDAQGRTDWTHVTQDDGSVDWTDYDQANVRGDRVSQTRIDAQGRADWNYVTQDDGSRDWTDYDQANERADGASQTHYDAQGRGDWTYVTRDDGSRDWIDYDQAGVRGDSVWQNRLDAQGREDWRYVTLDDGAHEWTDFDQANERTDSIWQSRTDASGREDWANVTMDDGSRTLYDYDQEGSRTWSRVDTRFDAGGRHDSSVRYFDDGSRFSVDFDRYGLGNHEMRGYDAFGRCIFFAEQVKGFVSTVFGAWNTAYGEDLGVQAVMPAPGGGGGSFAPPGSPQPFPHYDPLPSWDLEVEVRIPYES